MSVEIRQPNITAQDSTVVLVQMRSYLYQLAQQLNWAFSTLETSGSGSGTVVLTRAASAGGSQNAGETFAAIKGLIIKSAEIVNAYSDRISEKLAGQYVAVSDFGTFQQQTQQAIEKTSTDITQLFQNTQSIEAAISQIRVTNAYIRTGLLGEEAGTPIYGLEIGQENQVDGQTVFARFARFTAEKLSFYDSGGIEVAYISDTRLYITNATVTGSLELTNQFRISCDGFTMDFKWIGG